VLADTLAGGGIKLVSGGTDNHLMLADVTAIGLSGKVAEAALDRAAITVNKNMIPYDKRKPFDPSGIRIGTAALTTRNMKEDEMRQVGRWILEVLSSADDANVAARVREEIREFTADFPVPGIG
jgi:glycine hydroxymethyltransferase